MPWILSKETACITISQLLINNTLRVCYINNEEERRKESLGPDLKEEKR